jgi:thermitase
VRRTTISLLAVIFLVFVALPINVIAATPPSTSPSFSDSSSDYILVKFKPGAGASETAEIHRQLGGKVKKTIPEIGVQVVKVPKGQAKEKAKAYSSKAKVAYAEPDFVAEAMGDPDDPGFGYQWGLATVQAPQAWDVTTGSSSINIAILDTGVDLDHPDLADKIVANVNFSTSATADDLYGHGTHVAGIAAASTDNGIGVAGLGYSANIMNVKVLADNGGGVYSSVASGIIWAADNGADIINMSLGGTADSQALEDAVNYAWSKGVVVVVAAGNNGKSDPFYPASYTNCIAVAATDANDEKPLWSNYGDWVDVAAPGREIYSTLAGNCYGYMSGTSMASPHVAGLAALVFATVSDMNGDGKLNDEVRSRMEATCDNIGVSGIGHGRINAARAVGGVPVLPGTISGQVTDAGDGSAISGVRVSDGTRYGFTYPPSGKYTIDGVPPGAYQVVASRDGYESSSLTVTVLEGSTTVANLQLRKVTANGGITGTVTDAGSGSPIAGATVTDGTRTTTTDASGEYIIAGVPPATYQVTASKAGYESSSLTVTVSEGNTAATDLSLTRIIVPGTITGRVSDAGSGSPIAGATVTDGTRTTTTDASGEYTIAGVPPGTYQVTASKEGYESSSLTATVSEGNTAPADLALTRIVVPGTITGSITDAGSGSPIAGATVTANSRTTTTDASGEYTIAGVPPGTYQVTASKSGYESSSLIVTVSEGNTAVADLTLTRIIVPGTITGTITAAGSGSSIAGATVTDGTRTTTTDASGEYAVADVPPGTYQVTASKEGYESSSLTVTVSEGNTALADLALTRVIVLGTVTGTVTAAGSGSSIAGATVTDGTRTTTTDASGEYTIANVPPGTYQVRASKSGYESSSLTVTVSEGNTALADLSLTRIIVPGTITGSVTDAGSGSPIAGAMVTDSTRTATTDASGEYTMADVSPGTYEVTASKSGYESSSLTVTVLEGNTALADLALTRVIVLGTVTGTVTDAGSGSPIAGAVVTDSTRTTTTDASGEYTIANVPPGTYQVTGSKSGYESSSLTVTVSEGNTAVADLSLVQIIVPGTITGTVTAAGGGSPIAGATVTDGTRTTTTDASGEYTIAGVPPGTYQVTASKPGYESSSLTVTVSEGNTAVADLALTQIIVPGTITGTVTAAGGGSPIAGATVAAGTRTTTTDASGEYTIAGVPPGAYQVTASKSGYESSTTTATLLSGSTAVTNFSLNPDTPPSNEMWVNTVGFRQCGVNVLIEVRVMTASGGLIGANVALGLECSSGDLLNLRGTTDYDGFVTFRLHKPPVGDYEIAVTSLTCSGFVWDTAKGITTTIYALSR